MLKHIQNMVKVVKSRRDDLFRTITSLHFRTRNDYTIERLIVDPFEIVMQYIIDLSTKDTAQGTGSCSFNTLRTSKNKSTSHREDNHATNDKSAYNLYCPPMCPLFGGSTVL